MKTILTIFFKTIGIIFLILIGLFILAMIFFAILAKYNNSYKGNFKKEFNINSSKSAIIVFQPAKSSTKIANSLASSLNDSGYNVTITYPGKHFDNNMEKYDLILFGSPVFMGKVSKQITSSISNMTNYLDKKIVLYSVGQDTNNPELKDMKDSLKDMEASYTTKFVLKNDYLKESYDFGKEITK